MTFTRFIPHSHGDFAARKVQGLTPGFSILLVRTAQWNEYRRDAA